MDSTLQELSDLVCLRFPSYDPCIYGIRQLNIKSKCVYRKLRRDWTEKERAKIKTLLNQVMEYTSDDHKFKYYKGLIYSRVAPLTQ